MISAVVCTYNRCESLKDTLNALSMQDFRDNEFEILVVDNNSNDSTKYVVETAAKLSRWPIRYVFEREQGISAARNRGISEACGDILAFTDDDAIPEMDWIQKIDSAFSRFNADCVSGPLSPLWEKNPPKWLVTSDFMAHLGLLDKGPEPIVMRGSGDTDLLYGANMAIKRTVFNAVGNFRTDLGYKALRQEYGEDSEMLGRILKFGMCAVYAPDVIVRHKVSKKRMSLNYLRRWRYAAGRSQAKWKRTKTVPQWIFKECIGNAILSLWNYISGKMDKAIQHERQFWFQLGLIVESTRHKSS